MAQTRKRRRRQNSLSQTAVAKAQDSPIEVTRKPVRGMKLRTVSAFTMIFAMACLAAFIAGRPPVSAAGPVRGEESRPETAAARLLRHDNAGSLLRGRRGQRKTGAQKIEKGAGTRPSIRMLFADSQQKNEQPEHIGIF
jgi:hypothetical protein